MVAASGLPSGSLYHFFPGGKAAVAREAILTSGRAYQQLFEQTWDAAPAPAEGIGAFFEGAGEVFAAWRDSVTGRLRDAGVDQALADDLASLIVSTIEGPTQARAVRSTQALSTAGRLITDLVERATV